MTLPGENCLVPAIKQKLPFRKFLFYGEKDKVGDSNWKGRKLDGFRVGKSPPKADVKKLRVFW